MAICARMVWLAPGALPVLFLLVACAIEGVKAQGSVVSLEVIALGATVRSAPGTDAPRRGTVRQGTRLPMGKRVAGKGCAFWYELGPERFICEDLVRPSMELPWGERLPRVPQGALLPHTYAFVSVDGTWAYARPEDYFYDQMIESLGRGFGVVVGEIREVRGVVFAKTLRGLWIPTESLRFCEPSNFRGVELQDGRLDIAWVDHGGAALWEKTPKGFQRSFNRIPRRTLLRIQARLSTHLVQTDHGIVHESELIWPTPVDAPPPGIAPQEKWIDVDLRTQTLVAYEGCRPVYATLISGGRGGREHETPIGLHRIWVKLAEAPMDDLERSDVEANYSIEAVPWVQYFARGVGFHAAFWHDDFGRPRSHGCINLAPLDARWLFEWTEPALPPGWDAIVTTPQEPGTWVQVRRSLRSL
ncbi:MAG: L,D-transpeptidase family protein [Sandaracinaceae bacterium]|nr:L,D-transpeptidase family protein [Sandaracinaceae bacterium]